MRLISQNFTADEVACNCGLCDKSTADVELVWLLELTRQWFGGKPVAVHSWFRCADHNKKVGSSDTSWHLIGGAADISINGVKPIEICRFIRAKFPNQYGVGIYDWGVHLDVRSAKADWDNRRLAVSVHS